MPKICGVVRSAPKNFSLRTCHWDSIKLKPLQKAFTHTLTDNFWLKVAAMPQIQFQGVFLFNFALLGAP